MMSKRPSITIHNKSDKPDNIVMKQNYLIEECLQIESQLPKFMRDFFTYLKMVLPSLAAWPTSMIYCFSVIIWLPKPVLPMQPSSPILPPRILIKLPPSISIGLLEIIAPDIQLRIMIL